MAAPPSCGSVEPVQGIPVLASHSLTTVLQEVLPPLGERLPMDRIVAMDLAARDWTRPDISEEELPAPGMEWVPRPLVWVEVDWALKGFTRVSTLPQTATTPKLHVYRCILHRLDGSPCNAVVRLRNTYVLDRSVTDDGCVSAEDHLRDVHGIVAPLRPTRTWKRNLVSDCCCTVACVDCLLAPCCFYARLCALTAYPRGDLAPSFKRNMACSEQASWRCRHYTCAVFCALVLFPSAPFLFCLEAGQRSNIARKHNIAESSCEACCIATFCCPCSMVQRHYEHTAAGVWPGYCCSSRDEPLPTPEEVQQVFGALTREDVLFSRREPRAAPMNAGKEALALRALH